MALDKEEKEEFLKLLGELIETGRIFEKIHNGEMEEKYDNYLERLEELSDKIVDYEEKYKDGEGEDEFLEVLTRTRRTIENYFLFFEEEDSDLLDDAADLLEDLKIMFEDYCTDTQIFIDLPSIIPPLPLKIALSFDEAVHFNGLIKYFMDLGENLGSKKSRALSGYNLGLLNNSEGNIKSEVKLLNPDCPVDKIKLDIYDKALEVIDIYKGFIREKTSSEDLAPSLNNLKKFLPDLQELLAGYDKELKLMGLMGYLMDTGNKLNDICNGVLNEDEGERLKGRIYRFLRDDLKKIEVEKERYYKSMGGKFALEILELCRKMVENYIELIENEELSLLDENQLLIEKATYLFEEMQREQNEEQDGGLIVFLINRGKDLRAISSGNMTEEEKEGHFEVILRNLYRAIDKIEENKKEYEKPEEQGEEDVSSAVFALRPIDEKMKEIFMGSMEIVNNYIDFIEKERNKELIVKSFKIGAYLFSILEETDDMVMSFQKEISR